MVCRGHILVRIFLYETGQIFRISLLFSLLFQITGSGRSGRSGTPEWSQMFSILSVRWMIMENFGQVNTKAFY